jgi:phage pi2 protein 07
MRSSFALSTAIVLSLAPVAADGMKETDRQRLIAHLEMTESWLVSEVSGLTDAQLRYRQAQDSWSVMDVVEHLAVAEAQYWQRLQDSMTQPATTDKLEATDAGILWYGIDRSNRQRTGEARVPTGRWKDVHGSLAEFRRQRAVMLDYARTTTDDLRLRRLLEGNMDVYQWFLMISSHAQRHVLQIRDVKATPQYPD